MKPQLGSRSGAVLDGLLALFEPFGTADAVEGLSGEVQVLDGPMVGAGSYLDDVLSIASGTPEEPGFTVDRTPQSGLGRVAYSERTEVTCLISCFNGATNMKTRRDRAVEVFDAVKRCIDAHQVAPDAWDRLTLGPQEAWHPVQTDQGCMVVVGFTIVAESVV